MQFVPLWDSMLDNLKLHRLGPLMIGKWCYMLLAAQRHDALEGSLPDVETLSFWIRQPEETIREWLDELVAARLVDRRGKAHSIHDWDQWRCKGDRSARERMRRKRERDRNDHGNGHVTSPVTSPVTSGVTPNVTDEFPPRISSSSEHSSQAAACEHNAPPLPVRSSTSEADARAIEIATDRWGASSGDSVVGDLLRTFEPALVMVAMDRHWDAVGAAIKPALLRGICRGLWEDGWPPKVKLRSSPKARADPPTNQPVNAFNPPANLADFEGKAAENLKLAAELEARKATNGRAR